MILPVVAIRRPVLFSVAAVVLRIKVTNCQKLESGGKHEEKDQMALCMSVSCVACI